MSAKVTSFSFVGSINSFISSFLHKREQLTSKGICYTFLMPELPEVETIKLGLQKYVVGHQVEEIIINLPKRFFGDPKLLHGGVVIGIRRFGKGLLLDFSNGFSLAIHVKMTGQLLYRSGDTARGFAPGTGPVTPHLRDELPDQYTHVVFHLDNGAVLYYRDVRQFGWIRVVKTSEALVLPFFKSLGKEPLRDLTLTDFRKLLTVKTPIKTLFLDQHKIAGIGNIYANDALFLAGILPTRPAVSLRAVEQKKLFAAIEKVLKESIAVGGASASNYVNVLGEKGTYQDQFLVYKRDGKPCRICKTIVTRMTMGGRGTFICKRCQQ